MLLDVVSSNASLMDLTLPAAAAPARAAGAVAAPPGAAAAPACDARASEGAPATTPILGCDEGEGARAIPHAPLLLPAHAGPSGPVGALVPQVPVPAAREVRPPAALEAPAPLGTRLAMQQPDPAPVEVVTRVTTRRSPGQARWVGPCEPERPVMEILFCCLDGGRRLYSLRLNGLEIFTGTRPECDRFLEIHRQKVAQEQAEARRVQRARPFAVRTYRAARA